MEELSEALEAQQAACSIGLTGAGSAATATAADHDDSSSDEDGSEDEQDNDKKRSAGSKQQVSSFSHAGLPASCSL
jgi:hypothetical protein